MLFSKTRPIGGRHCKWSSQHQLRFKRMRKPLSLQNTQGRYGLFPSCLGVSTPIERI